MMTSVVDYQFWVDMQIYIYFCLRVKGSDHQLLMFFEIKERPVNFLQNKVKTTLLLNEGIPRALKGKKLRLKIPRALPSIFELFLVFQI